MDRCRLLSLAIERHLVQVGTVTAGVGLAELQVALDRLLVFGTTDQLPAVNIEVPALVLAPARATSQLLAVQ